VSDANAALGLDAEVGRREAGAEGCDEEDGERGSLNDVPSVGSCTAEDMGSWKLVRLGSLGTLLLTPSAIGLSDGLILCLTTDD